MKKSLAKGERKYEMRKGKSREKDCKKRKKED